MIITIRTDSPVAEIGLYTPQAKRLRYHTWQAHRELSATILGVIRDLLAQQHAELSALTGIVVFKGPGSFTGLRIGITVANTLAYGLQQPIVGTTGEAWQAEGLRLLQAGTNQQIILPEYGAEANITAPKK